ncbi:alpha/beta fold hydrolase [Streptomyces sp. NPDC055078]
MFIGANGIRLHVSDTGSGEPVVFLHGGSMDSTMWKPQIEHFAAGYRCLAWDARSHGKSDTTLGPHTYEMFSRDLYDLMESLVLDRAHIVGLSMGGMIAMQFATDHPDRVSTLSLMCTLARAGDARPEFIDEVAAMADNPTDTMGLEALNGVVSPVTLRERPELLTEVYEQHLRADPGMAERLLPAFRRLDLTDRLSRLTVPTVVLCGEHDELFTPLAAHQHIADTVPGAKLFVVPDAAHVANMENPAFVNDVLARHFATSP